jgi:hypothetical protein
VDFVRTSIVAIGGGLIVVGILELLSALGIFGHRGWGRALGLLISLVGILASIGGVVWALGQDAVAITVNGTLVSVVTQLERASVPAAPLAFYAIVFLCLLFGGGHFRMKEVKPRDS